MLATWDAPFSMADIPDELAEHQKYDKTSGCNVQVRPSLIQFQFYFSKALNIRMKYLDVEEFS